MKDGLVSVIIPTYNAASFLEATVQSVLSQTDPDLEIIIVNDGSTDGTPELADRLANQNPEKIRVLHQANSGVAASRNAGFALSQGQYLAFLDADDIWLPEKLAVQKKFLHDHPEVDVVFGDAAALEENGKVGATMMQFKHPASGRILGDLLQENFVSIPTTLLKRKVFETAGGFLEDRRFSGVEDYHFWLKSALKHTFAYIPQVLAHYRIRQGSLSSSKIAMWEKCLAMLEHFSSHYPEMKPDYQASYRMGIARNWYEMGYYRAGLGERPQARRCFWRTIRYQPNHIPAWKGWIATTLLPKSMSKGRFDLGSEAEQLFNSSHGTDH